MKRQQRGESLFVEEMGGEALKEALQVYAYASWFERNIR